MKVAGASDASSHRALRSVLAVAAAAVAAVVAALFTNTERLADAQPVHAGILRAEADAAVAPATVGPALQARALGLAFTQAAGTDVLWAGAGSAGAATAVTAAHSAFAVRNTGANALQTGILRPGTLTAGSAAAVLPALQVQTIGNAVLARPVKAPERAHGRHFTLHTATVEPADVVTATAVARLGYTNAGEVHTLHTAEAVAALATAAVGPALLTHTIRLADTLPNLAQVLLGASPAGSPAPVVTAQIPFAIGSVVAAEATKANHLGSAGIPVDERSPAILGLGGLAFVARVVWIFSPGRHTHPLDQAEEVLGQVLASSFNAAIIGARKAVVTTAARAAAAVGTAFLALASRLAFAQAIDALLLHAGTNAAKHPAAAVTTVPRLAVRNAKTNPAHALLQLLATLSALAPAAVATTLLARTVRGRVAAAAAVTYLAGSALHSVVHRGPGRPLECGLALLARIVRILSPRRNAEFVYEAEELAGSTLALT